MEWKWNGTLEMVDPVMIVTDHRYQRPPKTGLIDQIASNPVPEAFGVPVCFRRSNGVLYCADGQQRIAGILASEKPPRLIPIVWFPIEGVEHEAEIFVRINVYRKSLTPIEKHHGSVTAKDPAALAIARAVESVGFSIGFNTGSSRSIGAISALNYVYNLIGEDGVKQVLVQVREAWPDDRKSLEASLLRIVADVIKEATDNGGYQRSRVTAALKRTTPAALFRKAEEIHFDQGTSKRDSLRRAVTALAKV